MLPIICKLNNFYQKATFFIFKMDQKLCDNSEEYEYIFDPSTVGLDWEFVNTEFDGRKKRALGRVSIIDYYGRILMDAFVLPER